MKKLFSQFLVLLSIILISSCTDKFNVAAPYKNITVIYGILDQKDTAHYIRIQKAFLDQNKSAINMAQVADSNFYATLNVVIKRFDFSYNYVDSIHLNRVDLNLEGYPKQAGAFFNAPNYAYKFKNVLDASYIYRLVVTNLATGIVDSAETPIINDADTTVFTIAKLDDTDQQTNKIDFSSTIPGRSLDIAGGYAAPLNFMFNNYTTPVGIIQAILRFNWVDSNGSNFSLTPKYVDYNLGYTSLSNATIDYKVANTELYNALASGMQCAPFNTTRLLGRCQLYIYLGTQDFNAYQQIIQTQGTGLTGDEVEPDYTNIKGPNVLGMFTSRGMRSGYVTISNATFDSLRISSLINPCCQLNGKAYH